MYKIRLIKPSDNKQMEKIIRSCLIEFKANHEGTAWIDKSLSELSEVYNDEYSKYWVAEDDNNNLVGGVGIGKLNNEICELQKMYLIKEARGQGISHELIKKALDFAKSKYKNCYIETLSNMISANKFYQKYGFDKLKEPFISTEHNACDVWYLKKL